MPLPTSLSLAHLRSFYSMLAAMVLIVVCAHSVCGTPLPTTTSLASTSASLSQTASVSITFTNADASHSVGYGPLIDLVIPAGLSLTGATFLGVSCGQSSALVFSAGTPCYSHPLYSSSTTPYQVCGNPGDTFVSIMLPLTSVIDTTAPASLVLSLLVAQTATVNTALDVFYRGAFQFGSASVDVPCCHPILENSNSLSSSWHALSVVPTLFVCQGSLTPTDAFASGASFAATWTISCTIPTNVGTVNSLTITNILPDGVTYAGGASYSPATGSEVISSMLTVGSPATSSPSMDSYAVTWPAPSTSSSGVFSVSVPCYVGSMNLMGGNMIDPTTGASVSFLFSGDLQYTWTPSSGPAIMNTVPVQQTQSFASIAITKSSTIDGAMSPTTNMIPGALLDHTIVIVVSDYFAFDTIVVSDVLSDGHTLDMTMTPTLAYNDPLAGNSAATAFSAGSWSSSVVGGVTSIQFSVSTEESTRTAPSTTVLTGSCYNAGICAMNNGPTTATIKYRSVINDLYSGGGTVLPGDTLTNSAQLSATITAPGGSTLTPTAQTSQQIATTIGGQPLFTKSIYALNGAVATPTSVMPGDVVTYRLTVQLATGDSSTITLTDTLPLPTLVATTITAYDSIDAIPAAGSWGFGPSNSASNSLQMLNSDATSNTVTWIFNPYSSTSNTAVMLDLLFSIVVGAEPYINAYAAANTAAVSLGTTAGPAITDSAAAAVNLLQPSLTIAKIPLTANNPQFSYNPVANIATGIDASDSVEFQLTIRNVGGAGAFDLVIADAPPAAGYSVNAATLQLTLVRGDGTVVSYTGSATDLFTSTGLSLSEITTGQPLLFPTGSGAAGSDSLVVTYTLQVVGTVVPAESFTNQAAVLQYASIDESAINYVVSMAAEPTATTKTVIASPTMVCNPPVTSDAFTVDPSPAAANSGTPTPVAIGEQIAISHVITVPEGSSPSVFFDTVWPAGLLYIQTVSVISSSAALTSANGFVTTATTVALPFDEQWNWSTLTNTDSNNAVAEIVTLTYTLAIANDLLVNTNGRAISGSATWSWADAAGTSRNSISCVGAPLLLVVVQPDIALSLSASSDANVASLGSSVTYTMMISHSGTSTASALDMVLVDNSFGSSNQMALTVGSVMIAVSPAGAAASINANVVTGNNAGDSAVSVSVGELDLGQTVTVTFQATLASSTTPISRLTLRPSTATATYYSLPLTSPGASNRAQWQRTASDTVALDMLIAVVSSDNPSTSVSSTTGIEALAVGETFVTQIVVSLPEGTTNSALISVQVPSSFHITAGTVVFVGSQLTPQLSGSPVINGAGTTITFDFGQTNNMPDGIQGPGDQLVMQFTTQVPDTPSNTPGTTGTLSGMFASTVLASATVEVVLPSLSLSLSNLSPAGTPDAGDSQTFQVQVSPAAVSWPASDAYQTTVVITLPTGMQYTTGSVSTTSCPNAVSATPTATGVSFSLGDMAPTASCTINFQSLITTSVITDSSSPVSAQLTYNSMPTFVAGMTHTSSSSASVIVTFASPLLRISLSPPNPTPNYAIGDQVTYLVMLTLPEGTLESATLTVSFPAGGSAGELRVASAVISQQSAAISFPGGPPTITLLDNYLSDSVDDTAQISFGNIINSDTMDGTAETVTVTVTGFVANVPINVRGTPIFAIASLSDATRASPLVTSAGSLTVTEPQLQLAEVCTQPAAGYVSFTATISSPPPSNAVANAIELQNRFPATVYNPASVTVTSLPPGFTSSVSIDPMTGDAILTIESDIAAMAPNNGAVAPGQSVSISYSAQLLGAYGTTNTAQLVSYNSQPEPVGTAINGRLYSGSSVSCTFSVLTLDTAIPDFQPFTVDLATYLPSSPPLDTSTLTLQQPASAAGWLAASGTILTFTPTAGSMVQTTFGATICNTAGTCFTLQFRVQVTTVSWVTPSASVTWYMYFKQTIQWSTNLPPGTMAVLSLVTSTGQPVTKFQNAIIPASISNYIWSPHMVLPGVYRMRITTLSSDPTFNNLQWPDTEPFNLRALKPKNYQG